MHKYKPVDLSKIKTYSVKNRKSKVNKKDFAGVYKKRSSFKSFIDGLPGILAGESFKEIVTAVADAVKNKKPVIVSMGAHVIKCGLSPVIIDAVKNKIITAVATNGAGSIHDAELALFGFTSEDVSSGMKQGTFGMARESCEFINNCSRLSARENKGLGETIGHQLIKAKAPNADCSILAAAYKNNIPATVHLTIGGDINHMHPGCDGASLGASSFYDFRLFVSVIKDLGAGAVLLNFGSAVVLPVIIEKAITVARNLGYAVGGFTGANFDFIRHYRPMMNLVERVNFLGGRGFSITGHHEIMLPLLFAAVKEKL